MAKKLPLLSHPEPVASKRRKEPYRSKASLTGIRNILVIGDLHVGSIYGMLPPDFVSSDGAEKPQNDGQKYLWDCWQDMKTKAAKFSIDSVVVNGDLIEGKQPKQRASELTLVAPNDQESAAVFLMRDLRNWIEKNTGRQVPFFFVQGTEYHEGRGAEELESIAARVSPQCFRIQAARSREAGSSPQMMGKIQDRTCHVEIQHLFAIPSAEIGINVGTLSRPSQAHSLIT